MPPHRLRTKFRHAVNSLMVAFSISVGATNGTARTQPAPIVPQPFTTLPVRALPTPAITQDIRNAQTATTRGLTAGEKNLLRLLFGDSLAVDTLQLVFDRPTMHAGSDGDSATHLHIHDAWFYSKDYSREANTAVFGYFVNRMTGLVQQNAGDAWVADRSISGDMYLVDGRGFGQYGLAQQRAMMQDYTLRFLHATRQSHWLSRTYNGDRSNTDPYLIAAVETAFPSAKKGRLDYQHLVVRRLSAFEKSIVRGIFGDQLNTDIVRLHLSPLAYKDVAGAAASDRDVYLYGRNRSNDFSDESSYKLGIFIHEMTHIWQFQTNRQHTVLVRDQYKYTIESGARFQDYSIEQQAAMIEDYLLYTLHKDREVRWLAESYTKANLPARVSHMLATVETFFPTARAWRMTNQVNKDPLPTAPVETPSKENTVVASSSPPTPAL